MPFQDNSSHPTNGNRDTNITSDQTSNDKPQIATNPTGGAHASAKKDEIKILPAVVPVLGYTSAAAHTNLYPPIETGVQLFTGAQPTQSAAFPTTYQQGVCLLISLIC